MESIKIHRHMADLDGISIFYRDTETDGPPILCLHGRWGRGETWVDFMQHYGKTYRVIAPDQRGHGLSGKPVSRYTAEEMAGDMVALLDHLSLDSVIVVGHSMGGGIAGHLAAHHPKYVRALAILDKSAAGPKGPDEIPLDEIAAVDPVTKDWPLPFASLKEARECIRRDMVSDLSYEYFMNSLVETVEGYRMMFSSQAIAANIAHSRDWFDLLPAIRCPVMLARAKGGDAVTDEDFAMMKSLLANCLAYDFPSADHNVHLANGDEFYRCFDEFLDAL
jgi:2-succinyl-6-hydroxy-2,4-cyclohexadiene-1-carboxylate synthase